MESYSDGFTVHVHRADLRFLRDWQVVVRFGATALCIATVLVLLGLALGTRRSRFWRPVVRRGRLTPLIAPALTANYWGRYTVPMPVRWAAAAGIAIASLWRRRAPTGSSASAARVTTFCLC